MVATQPSQGRHQFERSTLAESSDTSSSKTPGQQVALGVLRTAVHFFPDLYERLEAVTDPRTRRDYTMTEILLGGIFLFVCKQGSRNSMNDDRAKEHFAANYRSLFGKELPHMDTVDAVLREASTDELECLKGALISALIEKKVLKGMRLLDKYYRVAVDATGIMAVGKGHCLHCLHKTSKKTGVTTYFHNLLEAKLITPNGFAISLASEWIENPDDYNKQDCEQKAFRRLAERLKKLYPRLPVAIHADGLYPNAPFFDICRANDWRWIVTLKDGSLKSLWEEVDMELMTKAKNVRAVSHPQKARHQTYRWLSGLRYQDHTLSWLECVEEDAGKLKRFVYVTDIEACFDSVIELTTSGRMRFKIENEGFNALKNGGYELSHKYSRRSAVAMKNYVCLMHIAHLINQLYTLSSAGLALWGGKDTLKALWKDFLSELRKKVIDALDVLVVRTRRIQIRFG